MEGRRGDPWIILCYYPEATNKNNAGKMKGIINYAYEKITKPVAAMTDDNVTKNGIFVPAAAS